MNIREIKGLKYPDEYFIKYFFKKGLHTASEKKFLEFGSSNGNNLMLPYQYGHNVFGVDFDDIAIKNAKDNFSSLKQQNSFEFVADDMRNFVENKTEILADVLMLPNIVNYIKTEDFIEFLKLLVDKKHIKKNADFFLRCRTPKDFRFGLGQKLAHHTYLVPDDYHDTGEAGCINRFYTQSELVDILREYIGLKEFKLFDVDCQNLHGENIVLNSDIVIWGRIN